MPARDVPTALPQKRRTFMVGRQQFAELVSTSASFVVCFETVVAAADCCCDLAIAIRRSPTRAQNDNSWRLDQTSVRVGSRTLLVDNALGANTRRSLQPRTERLPRLRRRNSKRTRSPGSGWTTVRPTTLCCTGSSRKTKGCSTALRSRGTCSYLAVPAKTGDFIGFAPASKRRAGFASTLKRGVFTRLKGAAIRSTRIE